MPRSLITVILVALFLPVPAATQPTPESTPTANELDDDEFGDLEDIEELDEVEASPSHEKSGFAALVGYFHSASVHMPIAWLLLVVLLDLLRFGLGREEFAKPGLYLLGLTVLAFIPAITTGLFRFSGLPDQAEVIGAAALHRNVMFAVLALTATAAGLRFNGWADQASYKRYVYLVVIGLAALLVGVGGHLGGEMVFGEPPSL